MRIGKIPTLAIGAALLAAAFSPVLASPLSKGPGATLIVPYFEVDLDAPDGRSTLVSVGNAGDPVVARATLWSDHGYPVYAWDIYLGKNALATYNLRDIVAYGTVTPTRAPAGFGGCGDPVTTPAISPADLLLLQKQLTGQDLGGGLCASVPREDPTLATGSLTIDAVTRCGSSRYPNDGGYFTGSQALASPRQVLWGDFTFVDPAENFAQGFEAPTLRTILTVGHPTFGGWTADPALAREALNGDFACSRQRYLQGGPFAAKTSFFVYTPPPQLAELQRCDISASPGGNLNWSFAIYDEDGRSTSFSPLEHSYRTSGRVEAGTDLQLTGGSGYVQLVTYYDWHFPGVPLPTDPIQHLLFGAIQASGRFAVGMSGNAMGADCQ